MTFLKSMFAINAALLAVCFGILAATPTYVSADAGGAAKPTAATQAPVKTPTAIVAAIVKRSGGSTRGN